MSVTSLQVGLQVSLQQLRDKFLAVTRSAIHAFPPPPCIRTGIPLAAMDLLQALNPVHRQWDSARGVPQAVAGVGWAASDAALAVDVAVLVHSIPVAQWGAQANCQWPQALARSGLAMPRHLTRAIMCPTTSKLALAAPSGIRRLRNLNANQLYETFKLCQ